MHSLWRSFRGVRHVKSSYTMHLNYSGVYAASGPKVFATIFTCERGATGNFFQQSTGDGKEYAFGLPIKYHSWNFPILENNLHNRKESTPSQSGISQFAIGHNSPIRCITTVGHPEASFGEDSSAASPDLSQPQRIKFKRPDKTGRHIMNILDKEAVEKVKGDREIPDIRPGYIIQLKVEVPENKRRVSTIKGIVIARRNAGLNTTFRLRRLVAGVGIESVFPLYSPNIKEMKVLDKRKVRRAKLYYLRDRMNPLKK